jgi:hypothetical protein
MKWIEMIRLRSAEKAPESLKTLFSASTENVPPGLIGAGIYRHALWETDWSLHLRWDSENPEKNGSALGIRLAQALKEFGLVDHSIWIDEIQTRRQ